MVLWCILFKKYLIAKNFHQNNFLSILPPSCSYYARTTIFSLRVHVCRYSTVYYWAKMTAISYEQLSEFHPSHCYTIWNRFWEMWYRNRTRASATLDEIRWWAPRLVLARTRPIRWHWMRAWQGWGQRDLRYLSRPFVPPASTVNSARAATVGGASPGTFWCSYINTHGIVIVYMFCCDKFSSIWKFLEHKKFIEVWVFVCEGVCILIPTWLNLS